MCELRALFLQQHRPYLWGTGISLIRSTDGMSGLWPEAEAHCIDKDKEVKALIVTSYQRYDAAYKTMQQLKNMLERGTTNSNGTSTPDCDKATAAAFKKQMAQQCLRIRDDILCPDHNDTWWVGTQR
jgi:hypothetical protein